jgi:hypothetical protein
MSLSQCVSKMEDVLQGHPLNASSNVLGHRDGKRDHAAGNMVMACHDSTQNGLQKSGRRLS